MINIINKNLFAIWKNHTKWGKGILYEQNLHQHQRIRRK